MNRLFFYFSIFIVLFHSKETVSLDDLKLDLVQVLFRHGARTPLQRSLNFYRDTNLSVYEPWGIGVLTNVGKQQSHKLGCFLRSRYKDHVSLHYKAEEIRAYSSAEDRTKMSMALVLAGLYPPSGNLMWNSSLPWSPVPFQYTPRELDVILRSYEMPKCVKLFNELRETSESKKKIQKYLDALKFLDEKTGVKASANFSTLTYVFDVLYTNEYMNLELPDWYTPKVKQSLIEVQEQDFDDYVFTEELRKVAVGPLVRTFVENMNLDKTAINPRKIYLYSGHEVNLALFTRVHGIQEFRYPHYGNALIFEKWRDSKNQVFVKLFAWTGTDELLALKLGTHNDLCPIEDYLKIVTPVMISDEGIDDLLKGFDLKQLKNLLFTDTAVTPVKRDIQ